MLQTFKVLMGTAGFQAMGQVLAFGTGLLVVRLLPLDQYALYTLAIAVFGAASTLADSGLANAAMAQGGRVWQKKESLGGVLAFSLGFRRLIVALALVGACPALAALALRQGGAPSDATILCFTLVPLLLGSSASSLLEIPLRLHQRLNGLQLTHIVASFLRLACVATALFLLPLAWTVFLVGVIPVWFVNSRLRSQSADIANVDTRQAIDEDTRSGIAVQTIRSTPSALYYVFSSQLTVLIISVFGTTEALAQVGALGRLAMIVTFFLAIFRLIAVPRYARIPREGTGKLLRNYFLLMTLTVAAAGSVVVLVWIFPNVIPYILGGQYDSLEAEGLLALTAGAVAVVASAAGALSAVRGVVISPLVYLPVCVGVQVVMIAALPLDSVLSMFLISLAVSTAQALVVIGNFWWWLVCQERSAGRKVAKQE